MDIKRQVKRRKTKMEMKTIFIGLILVLSIVALAGCQTETDTESPLVLGLDGEVLVNSTQVIMEFEATDNIDYYLDWEVQVEGEVEASGQMISGEIITTEFEIPEGIGINVTVAVYDLSGNVGTATVLVSLRDFVPPLVEIISLQ